VDPDPGSEKGKDILLADHPWTRRIDRNHHLGSRAIERSDRGGRWSRAVYNDKPTEKRTFSNGEAKQSTRPPRAIFT